MKIFAALLIVFKTINSAEAETIAIVSKSSNDKGTKKPWSTESRKSIFIAKVSKNDRLICHSTSQH